MFFLNPLHTINSLGKNAAFSGFTKLKNHFNLTENLKQAVAHNPAFATFATAGITAALIHPTTRMALATLLGMTYSMSMITLNLVMIGLYLGWMGIKGAKGFMETAKSAFSQASQHVKPENIVNNGPSLVKPEPSNGTPQAHSAPNSIPVENLRPENTPNPENWVQQFEEEFSSAQKILVEPQQWANEYSDDLLDKMLQELETTEQPFPTHPQSDVPSALQPNNWSEELSEALDLGQPNNHNWANELASNARKLPQFNVGEYLQFNNQIVGDQWAGEFVQEQAKQGIPNLVKYAGGALAVGVGVFAAVKIYQALKENDHQEEEVQHTSYASTTSADITNGTESTSYFGLIGNPLLF